MDGLVKLAWTKKRVNDAGKAFYDLMDKAKEHDELTDDELKDLFEYADKRRLKLNYAIYDDYEPKTQNFFVSNKNLIRKKKWLDKKQKPEDDDSGDDFFRALNEDDIAQGRDGAILSSPSRSTFTHELGHAIDFKRHPYLTKIPGISLEPKDYGILSGLLMTKNIYNEGQTEEGKEQNIPIESLKLLGTAAGIGTAAGALTMATESPTIAKELRANRRADEIYHDMYDKETADNYIEQSKHLRAAAFNTYKQNYLRNVKNAAIGGALGGGLGYGLGLGLNHLVDSIENKEQ